MGVAPIVVGVPTEIGSAGVGTTGVTTDAVWRVGCGVGVEVGLGVGDGVTVFFSNAFRLFCSSASCCFNFSSSAFMSTSGSVWVCVCSI